jgi:flagellar FliL protein
MLEVEDKIETTDADELESTTVKREKGGLGAMLPKVGLFLAVSLVAVAAAYFVTVKVLKPMMAQAPKSEAVAEQKAPEEPPAHAAEESSSGHGEEGGSMRQSSFHTIESIVVNPANTAGTRFLSCSVSFEVENKNDLKTFEALDVQIKDLLITILSSKTVDELSDVVERNRMRREILSVVNKLTAPAAAKAVYLTDFVLQ